jgi:kynureninase
VSAAATSPLRSLFHVPGPGPYLLTHSVGCMPKAVELALREQFLEPWSTLGGDAWELWLAAHEAFREALAGLLGGSATEYCPQPNLSAGFATLLGSLPEPHRRRRIWVAAEDSFPSLGFVLHQARKLGYELRLIPRSRSPAATQSWAEAITDEVCGALITHVHSNTGERAPVHEIARLCADRGALSIVDIAQSAGIVPLNVSQFGADVVLGSCVKWLCGGPGAGFMWVRGALIPSLDPTQVGWFSHAMPFEFDIHSYRHAPDARRFWGGTPTIAPFVAAAASVRVLQGIGSQRIWAHNRSLVADFIQALPTRWRERLGKPPGGGTLCLDLAEELPVIRAALAEREARFDCRGTVVRLSFHVCNSARDARTAAQAWPS